MTKSKRPIVVLLVAENTSPSVLFGLFDVLYSVGAVFTDMTLGAPGTEYLDVKIVTETGKPFRCIGNIMIEPHSALDDIKKADAVVVCDMYSPIDQAPVGKYPKFSRWLRSMHHDGAIITSVCSGALVLAEAGLLDGREAAAHWAYTEMFALHYPTVTLKRDSILCLSAEEDRIVTAGGVTSWQDLALYLIARLCGLVAAIETAKVHLLAGREHGQLPFAAMNQRINGSDQTISQCQEWIADNFATVNPVQVMAKRSGLSARTLSRRFRNATGRSPIDYVQALRVEEAKRHLEAADNPVDNIGMAVGYDDPASFRRLFRRLVGLTPAVYRRKFASLRKFGNT